MRQHNGDKPKQYYSGMDNGYAMGIIPELEFDLFPEFDHSVFGGLWQ